ncbi:MAG TPA: hypothetical protein VHT04_09610 [Stellaceae bacterium]|jgi:hypothetical protein|nr:hypothetical protein [Stellaceae bacterium]
MASFSQSGTAAMRARLDLTDLTLGQFALLFAACFLIAALPVLVVATPPLLDYPNHLARMHIETVYQRSPFLQQFYALDWRPIPNLAMDLVVPPLARIMPLAWAGKAFLLAIFLLMAGGTAALHRTLFGRWSAWSLLAFLLLYNRILLWGFVNFLFGIGLLMVATASWIALRERALWLRLLIAALLALALYLAHLFAFATYAFVILGYEISRFYRQGRLFSLGGLGELCASGLQFVPVLALLVLTAAPGSGGEIGWSRFVRKLDLLFNIVDNYHRWFDIATFALLVALFAAAAFARVLKLSRAMVAPLLLLCLVQLAMPNRLFNGTGVDHRMPLVLALLLIGASSIALADRRRQSLLAALLALLFVTRIGIVTVSWTGFDRSYAPLAAALARLPPGSLLAVASPPASVHVSTEEGPMTHVASLAVIAADAFVPTLFVFPDQQPLRFREPYTALAHSASPEDFWRFIVDGKGDEAGGVAAALSRYDYVLVTDQAAVRTGDATGLDIVARLADAALLKIRH